MRVLLSALLAVLWCGAAQAASQTNADTARLVSILQKTNTLSGQFSQLTLDSAGTNLQETKGEMAVQRPGMFRWHTDAPAEQLLVSDGKKVWLYDPDLNQVTVQTLDKRLTNTPALLLSGDLKKIADNFSVSLKTLEDTEEFTLIPKGK